MLLLYILIGLVGGLLIIVAILAILAPKETVVKRSIIINLPQEEAFEKLKSLQFMQEWSPWNKRDPNQEIKFSGAADGEIGSMYYWNGNKDVGEGEQEVTQLEPNSRIELELRFLRPFKVVNTTWYDLERADSESTKVTWGFHAYNKLPMSIFLIFMDMDKTLGKDFQEGLDNLKQLVG